MAARARLQYERKSLRQDREFTKNPVGARPALHATLSAHTVPLFCRQQNSTGYEAKPKVAADGSQDLLHWECSIPGKAGTIWAGGRMPLELSFTEDYPQVAPEATFALMPGKATSLFHPNVFTDGYVCIDILKSKEDGGCWQPSITIKTVLIALRKFLEDPNNSDPANEDAAQSYKKSVPGWEKKVREQMVVLKDDALAV